VIESNAALISAFPSVVRADASAAVAALPDNARAFQMFSVRIAGEDVFIPTRIYHEPLDVSAGFRLRFTNTLQQEMIDCIFSRHADGFIREKHLKRIVQWSNVWIPPFVIQLAGEYVIEILRAIEQALPHLDSAVYGDFVRSNPEFIQKTKQRIASYWDCYHRSVPREQYPGFRVQAFLEELEQTARLSPGPLRANS
jgi:hypothetical protein